MRQGTFLKMLSTIFLATFLWAQENTFPSTFIDVNNYSFHSGTQTGVRIVVFNIDEQRYQDIHYYGIPQRQSKHAIATLTSHSESSTQTSYTYTLQPLSPYVRTNLSQKTSKKNDLQNNNVIRFFSDGSIHLPANFPSNIILRTYASTQFVPPSTSVPQGWTQQPWNFHDLRLKTTPEITMQLTYKGTLSSITPEGMFTRLGEQQQIRYGKPFNAQFYYRNKNKDQESKPFSALNELKHYQGGELGYLGELCVEMTCISYGYLTRHTSQNRSNQGIDGIFTNDLIPPHIILTESKGQSSKEKQKSAKKILELHLNESGINGIHDSLKKMMDRDPKLQESSDLVRQYINDTPQNVSKLAHRLKVDGTCQYAGEILNKKLYNEQFHKDVTPDSPIQEKIESLNDTLKDLCNTPEQKVELLKAFLKSDEDLTGYILLPSQSGVSPLKPKKLSFNQEKNQTVETDENGSNISITPQEETAFLKVSTASEKTGRSTVLKRRLSL